jgi:hypothetical protein
MSPRSEKVERSFAHLCYSGGMRRCWLRGLARINKRYSLGAAAHNLSLVMRKLFGMGQPRSLQGAMAAICALLVTLLARWQRPTRRGAAGTLEAFRVMICSDFSRQNPHVLPFRNGGARHIFHHLA